MNRYYIPMVQKLKQYKRCTLRSLASAPVSLSAAHKSTAFVTRGNQLSDFLIIQVSFMQTRQQIRSYSIVSQPLHCSEPCFARLVAWPATSNSSCKQALRKERLCIAPFTGEETEAEIAKTVVLELSPWLQRQCLFPCPSVASSRKPDSVLWSPA